MQHQNLHLAVMHTKEEIFFFKKVQKHTKSNIAACLSGNSRCPLFLKNCICLYRSTDVSIFRIHYEFTEILFFKIFVIPGGNAPPLKTKKIQRGDISATLPNRSGRYQETSPTTWLNFYTPCKSQPISLPYYS